MTIIIDGYNVLKTILATSHISDHQREQFISHLARYAQLSHNKISIVFDGGQDVRPTAYPRSGIIVIYSGYRDSADDVIKNLIDQQQHRQAMLVSTDRELNRYAAACDLPSMDSTVFYGHMHERLRGEEQTAHQQKPAQSSARKRPGHESSEELDALMSGDAEKVPEKNEQEEGQKYTNKKSQARTERLSKEEKRLVKVVKKL